jgi:hypothetical protein
METAGERRLVELRDLCRNSPREQESDHREAMSHFGTSGMNLRLAKKECLKEA